MIGIWLLWYQASVTMDRISTLPVEIILSILSDLPLQSLLAFGETSRRNFECHILSLRRLRIAIFQKRLHAFVSFLQAGWATPDKVSLAGTIANGEIDSPHAITIIQPRLPYDARRATSTNKQDVRRHHPVPVSGAHHGHGHVGTLLRQMIRTQNEIFARFVNRYGRSLAELEFMAYDLDATGAQALGQHCQRSLRHLALRFEHSHIRDGFTKPTMWLQPAPGSAAWNALIGIGPQRKHGEMRFTGLETLVLERAGITPWQLTMLVRNNPNLRMLKMRTCSGAQPEFLNWLGGIESDSIGLAPGARLETLWLENCQQVMDRTVDDLDKLPDELCDFGLEWVRGLSNLKVCRLSLCLTIY